MIKNIFTSYTVSVFLLIIGIVSLVQANNPSFLASADSVTQNSFSSGTFLLIVGLILILLAILLTILKVIRNMKKR
ncbi:MAG: hypothetical protein NTZ65_00865 [Candidatus Berkelbacteria bacterium]|nr:hypothetical protein [Candidatus Berkelbacteria bacterium]